jgi:predicted PurR-regulated permease PerM
VEGNILQPLVQQRTVFLAPAMILIAQVVLGILVGTLGVMLATPLAATFMVWVKMLYVEDTLGKTGVSARR